MQLSPEERIAKLARWKNPPSVAEEQRLERALRMVTRAVQQHPQFAGLGLSVEAKGSWANNTNVSSDSDVDIKVEFTQRAYRGVSASGMNFWELVQHRPPAAQPSTHRCLPVEPGRQGT